MTCTVHCCFRYGHRAVFIANTSEILMYGGMAYVEEQAKALDTTFISQVVPEMWYFSLFHCISNCSSRGTCYYGHQLFINKLLLVILIYSFFHGRLLHLLRRLLWRGLLQLFLPRYLLLLRPQHPAAGLYSRLPVRLFAH